MHQHFRVLTLLGIFSLTLLSLAGCGEKRMHVTTSSGAPGDEIALEPIEEMTQVQPGGLGNSLVDESNLSSQIPDGKTTSAEPEGSSDSSPSGATLASLADGPGLSTQSNSSPAITQDFTTGLMDALSGEGIEPVPDPFQIAKAEPSGSIEDRMNRIKAEELAAAAAGLEDVFFQFDSWTLTQEGKQTLERTVGWFTQDPSSNLIIEGHTDQRGTQAYNMVLAKKRAVAVQDYLSQLGIEVSRIGIISYGKDKPFCQDATEVCYQLNRRGHLLVQNP